MTSIRQIEFADIPDLFRIRVATDQNRLSIEELAALGITEATVRQKLSTTFRGWLCEAEGKAVGFAIGDRATGELWVIAVVPTHIRRGIGGALLEKVHEWLFAEGCTELWLTTDIDTTLRAYTFYLRHGWTDWKIENGLRYMRRKAEPGVR
jgi:GNAT superfamily N-acetyltransferase